MKIEKFQWELWEGMLTESRSSVVWSMLGMKINFVLFSAIQKKSQPMQTYQRSLHNFMEDKPTILAYAH
jgi:hypothetical protein